MRVLKKGTGQKGWSKKVKCTGGGNGDGGCGASLLVEEADIYTTSSSHYDGSTDHYNTFKCSDCGVETDISDNSVPSHLEVPNKKDWEALQKEECKVKHKRGCQGDCGK